MELTAERFRALARSSPWRWSSLRFVLQRRPERGPFDAGVRAWLRRPDRLRVEHLDGELIQVVRDEPRTVGLLTPSGGQELVMRQAASVTPVVGADGLVRERPSDLDVDVDDPMFQDYAWVAMLDPVELADGDDGRPGTTLEELRAVEHHGREAWEALVVPTRAYAPRCSCCPLLPSVESDRRLAGEGGPSAATAPRSAFADAHLVRLDVGTGVCVAAEELGGDHAGRSHEVRIEAVDEDVPDELFVAPRRTAR